jgi:hypothetical protein
MVKKKKPQTNRGKTYEYKSFFVTKSDKEMLQYLSKVYGLNESAVIRRLITEAFSILRYVEQKK